MQWRVPEGVPEARIASGVDEEELSCCKVAEHGCVVEGYSAIGVLLIEADPGSYFSLTGSSLGLELCITVKARPVHVQNTKGRE